MELLAERRRQAEEQLAELTSTLADQQATHEMLLAHQRQLEPPKKKMTVIRGEDAKIIGAEVWYE
jgi:hypothetical protein